MKKIFVWMLAGVMTLGLLTGCASFKGNETVLTVNGSKLTIGEAHFYATYTQAQYETYMSAYMGEDMWNSEADEGKTYAESVKEDVLNNLETMLLLEEHMSEYNVTMSEEEQKLIDDTVQEFADGNGQEVKEKISGDPNSVKRVITLMAIQQKMSEAIMAKADTEVSDEEAAQKSMEYVMFPYTTTGEDGQTTDLTDEEKNAARADADKIVEELNAGGDFATLVKDKGLEVQTATFDKESTTPNADVITAADALAEGANTGVIEAAEGCYIARLTSLMDRDATDAMKEQIVSERKSTLYTETSDKWREEAKIDVDKKLWNKVDFSKLTVTMKVKEEIPYSE